MRILLVSQEFPPDTAHGGIATQTAAKAAGLAARGHQVVVLTYAAGGRTGMQVRKDGVQVLRLEGPAGELAARGEAWRWLGWSECVAAAIAAAEAPLDGSFDLIDFPEYGAEAFHHLMRRKSSGPLVAVQLHGPIGLLAARLGWPEPGSELARIGPVLEAECVRRADLVYSSSAASAAFVRDAYGLASRTIPVLHMGVDLQAFRPAPQGEDPVPRIVFAGRIAPAKGVADLFEACTRLAPDFPGLRLQLVGRSEDGLVERLRERSASLGLAGLLRVDGPLTNHDLPRALHGAWVFAAPSHCEGGPGFVYLEAMACGLPALACAGTGAAEAVHDGTTGLLVPPGDPDAIAAALRTLLGDGALRRRMGAAGRAFVEERADRNACIAGLEELYDHACAGRAARPR
ncbi:MAG TPA: glycosyltransferase family 4 protein [Planctomycetota bacterium]